MFVFFQVFCFVNFCLITEVLLDDLRSHRFYSLGVRNFKRQSTRFLSRVRLASKGHIYNPNKYNSLFKGPKLQLASFFVKSLILKSSKPGKKWEKQDFTVLTMSTLAKVLWGSSWSTSVKVAFQFSYELKTTKSCFLYKSNYKKKGNRQKTALQIYNEKGLFTAN